MSEIVVLTAAQLDERLERAAQRGAELALAQQPKRETKVTIEEAAEELRCSTRKVRRLIKAGKLRATQTTTARGSRQLISRASLDELRGDA